MIRTGTVSTEIAANLVEVELDNASGCNGCSRAGGCGIQFFPTTHVPIKVQCRSIVDATLRQGDRVRVSVAEPTVSWLRVVLLAYGLPTVGMLVGAFAGYGLAEWTGAPSATDLYSLIGLVIGLAGGLFAWNSLYKAKQHNLSLAMSAGPITVVEFIADASSVGRRETHST